MTKSYTFASCTIPIEHHVELPSTNDRARELLRDHPDAVPFVISARRQTAGRGRGENVWWSDEGSAMFTVGLAPSDIGLTERHLPCVALVAAVAVIDLLEREMKIAPGRLGIRWPNDIAADGLKLGGILPERIDQDGHDRLIVGVGINVTTRLEDAPPTIQAMATSIERLLQKEGAEGDSAVGETAVAGCHGFRFGNPCSESVGTGSQSGTRGTQRISPTLDLATLPGAITAELIPLLEKLAHGDPALPARWAMLDVLRDWAVRIDLGNQIVSGVARGIDASGGLIVDSSEGRRTLHGGRVLRK